MRQPLLFAFVLLVTAACGSDQVAEVGASTTPAPNAETTTAVPLPSSSPAAIPTVATTPEPEASAPALTPIVTPGPLPTLIPPTPEPSVDTVANDAANLMAYQDALALWQQRGSADYDLIYQLVCFCGPETDPYQVSVRDGRVVEAENAQGVDMLDIEELWVERYDQIVSTVDEIFAEIADALDNAASFSAEYDPELGYPTRVSIDWDLLVADEEIGYQLADLRATTTTCSTAGVRLTLTPQPGLPAVVAAKRHAIYDAAVACDIEGLLALTAEGFKANFGDVPAAIEWPAAEARGEGVLFDLINHLNQAFTPPVTSSADDIYVWPSAFGRLQAADGTGLPAGDYASLLELYPLEELQRMFDDIGGYIGYRLAITTDGDWIFFLAGD